MLLDAGLLSTNVSIFARPEGVLEAYAPSLLVDFARGIVHLCAYGNDWPLNHETL